MVEILPVDTTNASTEEVKAIHDLLVVLEAEQLPDEPPRPFPYREAALRARPPAPREIRRWVADVDGRVVAHAWAMRWDDPDNSLIWVGVDPSHRRRGIGRALFSTAVEAERVAGSTKVIVDCPLGAPWETQLEAVGLSKSLTERISRLRMADIDWSMIDGWIARAPERAVGYHLRYLEAPIPDENIENWCRVLDVMNTAPLEDLDLTLSQTSPEKWRERERAWNERGDHLEAFVAVHEPSGLFVGYTDVVFETHRPDVAHQVDTAVDPAHRDRGLGRWLKAEMARRIAAEHPSVDRIFTANVGSNEPMLSINKAMGFEPVLWQQAWQGDLEAVREALAPG